MHPGGSSKIMLAAAVRWSRSGRSTAFTFSRSSAKSYGCDLRSVSIVSHAVRSEWNGRVYAAEDHRIGNLSTADQAQAAAAAAKAVDLYVNEPARSSALLVPVAAAIQCRDAAGGAGSEHDHAE